MKVLHRLHKFAFSTFHFLFLRLPFLLFLLGPASRGLCLVGLCSFDHSCCSCLSRSGVSSPSFTSRSDRVFSVESPPLLCPLWPLLPASWWPPNNPSKARRPPRVCSVSATAGSLARIRRVIFRTPCWMTLSSSCWISRTMAVSGNMSMKR